MNAKTHLMNTTALVSSMTEFAPNFSVSTRSKIMKEIIEELQALYIRVFGENMPSDMVRRFIETLEDEKMSDLKLLDLMDRISVTSKDDIVDAHLLKQMNTLIK